MRTARLLFAWLSLGAWTVAAAEAPLAPLSPRPPAPSRNRPSAPAASAARAVGAGPAGAVVTRPATIAVPKGRASSAPGGGHAVSNPPPPLSPAAAPSFSSRHRSPNPAVVGGPASVTAQHAAVLSGTGLRRKP